MCNIPYSMRFATRGALTRSNTHGLPHVTRGRESRSIDPRMVIEDGGQTTGRGFTRTILATLTIRTTPTTTTTPTRHRCPPLRRLLPPFPRLPDATPWGPLGRRHRKRLLLPPHDAVLRRTRHTTSATTEYNAVRRARRAGQKNCPPSPKRGKHVERSHQRKGKKHIHTHHHHHHHTDQKWRRRKHEAVKRLFSLQRPPRRLWMRPTSSPHA